MNIFERLFGEKKFPFDQILDIVGRNGVGFWNGTNCNGEVMFKRTKDCPNADYTIGGSYYTFEDPPPFCKIDIGVTGADNYPFIEIYVHQNTEIIWISSRVDDKYNYFDRKTYKKLTRLLEDVRKDLYLRTNDEIFRKMMAAYFEADIYSRVRHSIMFTGITERNLAYLKRNLETNEIDYVNTVVPFKIAIANDVEIPDKVKRELTVKGKRFAEWEINELVDSYNIPREKISLTREDKR